MMISAWPVALLFLRSIGGNPPLALIRRDHECSARRAGAHQEDYGIGYVSVGGLCAGGYVGLRSTVARASVAYS